MKRLKLWLRHWLGIEADLDFLQSQYDAQAFVLARCEAELVSRRDRDIEEFLAEVKGR